MIKKNLTSIFIIALSLGLSLTSCSDDDGDNNNGNDNEVILYASNNSNGNITVYDFDDSQTAQTKSLITVSTAADGIYYDSSTESVFQASRSGNNLEGFVDIDDLETGSLLDVSFEGMSDMQSPREVAVNGDVFVVADNADVDGNDMTPDGRLYIYNFTGTEFTLRNVVTTDFALWGITFDGNDLYAVVDKTNELAVYTNFVATNTTNATVSATKRIAIEGIVRTHGLTYDAASDTMIMTDIGDAGNGQDDGGFHIIEGFTSKFNAVANGGTMAVAGNQVRVSGAATLLGNPVDVAYDSENEVVYIAEAGNGGGRVLGFSNFDFSVGGNIAPTFNSTLASASSVYLNK